MNFVNNIFNSKKLKNLFLKESNPFLRGSKTITPVPPPETEYWVDENNNFVVDENGNKILAP